MSPVKAAKTWVSGSSANMLNHRGEKKCYLECSLRHIFSKSFPPFTSPYGVHAAWLLDCAIIAMKGAEVSPGAVMSKHLSLLRVFLTIPRPIRESLPLLH